MIITAVNAVDVCQEDIADVIGHPHVILDVQCHLKIILPVLTFKAVLGNYGIATEDTQPVEIRAKAIEHDDVGRDNEKVPRKRGISLVELVEIAPGKDETQHFCFAASRRHLDDITHPRFLKEACCETLRAVVTEQIVFVPRLSNVMEP